LGSKKPDWPHPSADWVRECERLVELDRLLPKVLRGDAEPTTAAERLELASLCQHPSKPLHATAARPPAAAFAAAPQLADNAPQRADTGQHHDRSNAACSAALAAAGQAEDAKLLPDRVALALRRQALTWLRAHLALCTRLTKLDPNAKAFARQWLAHWLEDTD